MTQPLTPELTQQAINTIRMLAVDGVEKAKSGHPGMPMGSAPYAFTIWGRYLRYNPADPEWAGRDRFVLSAGHGSMLIYSLLHLAGFDLPLDELKRFRQWNSLTPGHPEYGLTPGVETTTGPLGQGFCNGVGMAIAAKMTSERYNTADHKLFDTTIYGIVSDGDLMEGVTAEAASLAGHLGLGNIVYFYDDNEISIEGSTDIAFTEDRGKRFEAYGWQVLSIDGADPEAAAAAIDEAIADTTRPALIMAKTRIGEGSPNKVDTAAAHGAALGADEVAATKAALGWPLEPDFYIPEAVSAFWSQRAEEQKAAHDAWQAEYAAWKSANPELASSYESAMARELPDDLEEQLLAALPDPNATRRLSGALIQELAKIVPNLVGGSADLAPSNNTHMKGYDDIATNAFGGRNFHFGVREHAMGSIINGMSLYGGYIPFGATFLVFADYMRPPIRLANLMGVQVIYVFTHDSIFVGEDGPTHEPVEQAASLRLIPGMTVMRPADGAEVAGSWAWALRHQEGPTAILLTRQGVPAIEREGGFSFEAFNRGGYVVSETAGKTADVVLVGTGSELQYAVAAKTALEKAGMAARVVSMPSRDLFMRQSADYIAETVPAGAKKVLIEAGTRFGWGDVVGSDALFITQDEYGHSAPYKVLMDKLGFNDAAVIDKVLAFAKS